MTTVSVRVKQAVIALALVTTACTSGSSSTVEPSEPKTTAEAAVSDSSVATTSSTGAPTTEAAPPAEGAATTTDATPSAPFAYVVVAEEDARRLAVIDPVFPCTGCELEPTVTMELPDRPHNLAATGSVVYATHPSAGSISRVDVAEGTVQTVDVGTEPHDIKYHSAAGVLVAADEAGRALLTLHPATLEILDTVTLPAEPHDVAIAGDIVWVTLRGRDELAAVRGRDVTLHVTGGEPHDLIVAGDDRIWFSNWSSSVLTIFDPASGETVEAPPGVAEPHHFALDAEDRVWVSDNGGASIVSFSEEETKTVEVGPIPHHLVAVDDLLAVAVSGSGEVAFVRDGAVVARSVLTPGLHGVPVVELERSLS